MKWAKLKWTGTPCTVRQLVRMQTTPAEASTRVLTLPWCSTIFSGRGVRLTSWVLGVLGWALQRAGMGLQHMCFGRCVACCRGSFVLYKSLPGF